jgi:hypothetical protein
MIPHPGAVVKGSFAPSTESDAGHPKSQPEQRLEDEIGKEMKTTAAEPEAKAIDEVNANASHLEPPVVGKRIIAQGGGVVKCVY